MPLCVKKYLTRDEYFGADWSAEEGLTGFRGSRLEVQVGCEERERSHSLAREKPARKLFVPSDPVDVHP